MNFTEFHFDSDAVEARRVDCHDALAAEGKKLEVFGAQMLYDHLKRHGASRYLDYGPYWPALKDIFLAQGLLTGSKHPDREVARAYCGKTAEETIVMAEMFRDFYRGHYFIGTNTFQLDGESEEPWRLYDADMEVA